MTATGNLSAAPHQREAKLRSIASQEIGEASPPRESRRVQIVVVEVDGGGGEEKWERKRRRGKNESAGACRARFSGVFASFN